MAETEETTFKLCRREPIEKEGQAVVYCAKPIKTPNASNWCDECRQRLPFWPKDDDGPRVVTCLDEQGARVPATSRTFKDNAEAEAYALTVAPERLPRVEPVAVALPALLTNVEPMAAHAPLAPEAHEAMEFSPELLEG